MILNNTSRTCAAEIGEKSGARNIFAALATRVRTVSSPLGNHGGRHIEVDGTAMFVDVRMTQFQGRELSLTPLYGFVCQGVVHFPTTSTNTLRDNGLGGG